MSGPVSSGRTMRNRVRGAAVAAALAITVVSGAIVTGAAPAATAAEPELITVSSLLNELAVITPASIAYDRDLFIEGVDEDGDGCRTRQEVLIEESNHENTTVGPNCTVSGRWVSTLDGIQTTDTTVLEMDHLVALKEAWVSGAWAWNEQQRMAFANDLGDYRSLHIVTSASNQAKGDKDPARWHPTYSGYYCHYVNDWVAVKWRWNLAIDQAEKDAIRAKLTECGGEPTMVPIDVPAIGRPASPVAYVPGTPPPPVEEPPVEEPPVNTDPVAVYRFWSPVYQGHFFTTDVSERDQIIARWSNVWTYEGRRYTAFTTQVSGTIPLYRFWSTQYSGHFYTADTAERDAVIAKWPNTWKYEGVGYYVYPSNSTQPDTVPVARFWSNSAAHHFYTADAAERDAVRAKWSNVWAYEGDNFRVPAAGIPVPPPPAQPPGNPGDTKNCTDFPNYAAAKAWFDTYYPHYGDVAKLDADNNLIPCESLPGAP